MEEIDSSPVYLRDLDKEKQTDSFLGKGTEKLKKKADKEGYNVIVGYYLKRPRIE